MKTGVRPCKCLRTFRESKYRYINVTFREGATVPSQMIDSYTFADSQCPHCNGEGFITESADSPQEIQALMRDFERRLRKRDG